MIALGWLIGLIPRWLWAGLVITGLVCSYAGGWMAGADRVQARWDADRYEMAMQIEQANAKADKSAQQLADAVSSNRKRATGRSKGVEDALDADRDWGTRALPDGVRRATETAAADALAGWSD